MTGGSPAYSRAYRDRKRGAPPRTPAPCGTRAAAVRHRRRGEPLCAPCVAAERAYVREAARRARSGPSGAEIQMMNDHEASRQATRQPKETM